MEQLRVNGTTIDLIPAGIRTKEKSRIFIISTTLTTSEVEQVFSDVTEVVYISASGEEKSYLDCVSAGAITNHMDGTYSIEVSINPTERKITDLQKYTDSAICELTLLMSMMMMGGF